VKNSTKKETQINSDAPYQEQGLMCTALPGHAQAVTVGANSRIKLPELIECLILLGPRRDLCDHPASSLGKF
jgi:hypothetical protein